MSIRDKLRCAFSIAYVRAGRFALWTILLIFLLVVGIVFAIADWGAIWEWLQEGDSRESNGATLRNVGLVIAAVIALPLAIWRSLVAQRQVDTAERGLLNERYQKSAEMLGSEVLGVRLGGIYALQSLAGEHPELYHIQIMRLFCAFVRQTTESEEDTGTGPIIREDVQAVMDAIGSRGKKGISLEEKPPSGKRFWIDLSAADLRKYCLARMNLAHAIMNKTNLSKADLTNANLHRAILSEADLSHADLIHANLKNVLLRAANLSSAKLYEADLTGANLLNADLSGANLARANLKHARLWAANLSNAQLGEADLTGAELSGANLSGVGLVVKDLSSGKTIPAIGLAQAEFDKAVAEPPYNPPVLDPAVTDPETDKPLVWRGKTPG